MPLSHYRDLIRSILPDCDPRWIIAWMRVNTGGTFDLLSSDDFASHARFASVCAAEKDAPFNERLAAICGV